ncbi:MAG: CRISPR-associated endonuclease Cas3'', partial [Bacilli bacterium]
MEYYAHSSDRGQYQLIADHLIGVADQSKRFADSFGAGYLGYVVGILHDIGKYSAEFQQRIRGSSKKVDHSTAGAQWIMKQEVVQEYLGNRPIDKYLARVLAYEISGHHGGLRNYVSIDAEGTLKHRLAKQDVPDWSQAWREIKVAPESRALPSLFTSLSVTEHNIAWKFAWKYSFFGRMLYSCLVDADTIDTRNFCEGIDQGAEYETEVPIITQLLYRYDAYMKLTYEGVKDTIINRKRKQIREACERQAQLSPRMFSLSVPTGGGKTLSSLSFALRHAVQYEKRRMIYVIPFTSIIEQNAKQFRDAIGSDAVLEHHSNISYEEYEENNSLEEG